MSWTRFIFLTELMVDHVSHIIQLLFMMSVNGMLVIFCVMVITTCSDCDPSWELDVDYGQFSAYCPLSWQRYHVTSTNVSDSFLGLFSAVCIVTLEKRHRPGWCMWLVMWLQILAMAQYIMGSSWSLWVIFRTQEVTVLQFVPNSGVLFIISLHE